MEIRNDAGRECQFTRSLLPRGYTPARGGRRHLDDCILETVKERDAITVVAVDLDVENHPFAAASVQVHVYALAKGPTGGERRFRPMRLENIQIPLESEYEGRLKNLACHVEWDLESGHRPAIDRMLESSNLETDVTEDGKFVWTRKAPRLTRDDLLALQRRSVDVEAWKRFPIFVRNASHLSYGERLDIAKRFHASEDIESIKRDYRKKGFRLKSFAIRRVAQRYEAVAKGLVRVG